jgi:hypothetical protein
MILEAACVSDCDGKKEMNLDTSPSDGDGGRGLDTRPNWLQAVARTGALRL